MSVSMTISIQKLEYGKLNEEIKRTMRRSARDVVRLGFMLRRMMEKALWAEDYSCFDDYLAEELHLDYSMATRFMNINRKYSVSGNSMEIAKKYEGYSQGLLIEMLNMPQELEERVSPDMTVKQVREIKRQAKAERESPAPDKVEETVIDGEYRELNEPEEEKVATSQPEEEADQEEKLSAYGMPKTVYPEGSLIAVAGCGNKYSCFNCARDCEIRQEDSYCVEAPFGNPFPCTTMHVLENIRSEIGGQCQFINLDITEHTTPCCKKCDNTLCGYRCTRSKALNREAEPIDSTQEPKDELTIAKDILKYESKLLDGYLECGDLPEMTVLKQKVRVAALASMVCDLEAVESASDLAEVTQPELPALKNNDQRKEWLNNYKAWGLWYRDENIDVNYYKYDFTDGSRLIVAEYPQRRSYYSGEYYDEHYYHLLEKNRKGFKKPYDEQFRQQTDSETYLVEFLKSLQKKK